MWNSLILLRWCGYFPADAFKNVEEVTEFDDMVSISIILSK